MAEKAKLTNSTPTKDPENFPVIAAWYDDFRGLRITIIETPDTWNVMHSVLKFEAFIELKDIFDNVYDFFENGIRASKNNSEG